MQTVKNSISVQLPAGTDTTEHIYGILPHDSHPHSHPVSHDSLALPSLPRTMFGKVSPCDCPGFGMWRWSGIRLQTGELPQN